MKHLLRTFALAFAALILTATSTFATSDAVIDRMNSIGSYYYNPEGTLACAGAYYGDITVYGGEIEEKLWTGLTSFMSEAQAAGVMGNMLHESGYNPARHETSALRAYQPGFALGTNSSVAYGLGLIQWSYGRRVRLYSYISSNAPGLLSYLDNYSAYGSLSGSAFTSAAGDAANQLISLELAFLRDELNSGYSGFFSTSTVAEAAQFFLEQVERPQNPTLSAHPERLSSAEAIYNRHSDTPVTPTKTGNSANCTNSSGASGSLQSLVLAYAWPTYHEPPYTQQTSAYAEVIARRAAAGKYIGGNSGNDCGGFVTTLMQESGFAPDYNSGNGDTSAQEAWVQSHGWRLLNGTSAAPVNTSILQPGDVAFTNGHTFVYVGNIPGFSSVIASASIGTSAARAPMAGHESLLSDGSTIVRWYRKP